MTIYPYTWYGLLQISFKSPIPTIMSLTFQLVNVYVRVIVCECEWFDKVIYPGFGCH